MKTKSSATTTAKPQDGNMTKTKETNTKLDKQFKNEHIEKTEPNTSFFDITNALSQMKVSVPLLEMMKFPKYKEKNMKMIYVVLTYSYKDQNYQGQTKEEEEEVTHVVYLGTTITKDPSQVDPFYMTLMINNKLVRNCMLDSRAAMNIMPFEVKKELGVLVDTTYGSFYAIENRYVPMVES